MNRERPSFFCSHELGGAPAQYVVEKRPKELFKDYFDDQKKNDEYTKLKNDETLNDLDSICEGFDLLSCGAQECNKEKMVTSLVKLKNQSILPKEKSPK